MAEPDRGADHLDDSRSAHDCNPVVAEPDCKSSAGGAEMPRRSAPSSRSQWRPGTARSSPYRRARPRCARRARPSSLSFFTKETVDGCGGPNGASLLGTKNRSPWNTTFSAGSQAMTISRACGFGPMSMSSSLRVLSSSTRLPFSISRNSRLARLARQAVVLLRGRHVLDHRPVCGGRDDGRALGDEAAHAADMVAVVMRHGDVADRLAGEELLDALDHGIGAVARTGRFDAAT